VSAIVEKASEKDSAQRKDEALASAPPTHEPSFSSGLLRRGTAPSAPFEYGQLIVYTRAKSPDRVSRASMSYWRLPERLDDDPEDLAAWAGRALAIAERKKIAPCGRAKAKPPSTRAKARR
jgi:hypothetical protein